jgi:hypothetical protein
MPSSFSLHSSCCIKDLLHAASVKKGFVVTSVAQQQASADKFLDGVGADPELCGDLFHRQSDHQLLRARGKSN